MGHPTINPQIIVILTLKANIYRVLDKYTWYSKISESKTWNWGKFHFRF